MLIIIRLCDLFRVIICYKCTFHIHQHLKSSSTCRMAYNENCFKARYSAYTDHYLKIKEALNVPCERPDLNKKAQHFIYH